MFDKHTIKRHKLQFCLLMITFIYDKIEIVILRRKKYANININNILDFKDT